MVHRFLIVEQHYPSPVRHEVKQRNTELAGCHPLLFFDFQAPADQALEQLQSLLLFWADWKHPCALHLSTHAAVRILLCC